MSNKNRVPFITLLTLVVIGFSAYVLKVVLPREDFRTIDLITVGFTLLAILKDVQLIYLEVKHRGNR